jgi:antitoxin component of RelBE/YafQ-DinJ toxin-antitoxin module
MPTKDSNILTARVDNETIETAKRLAKDKGITINRLINRSLESYIALAIIINNLQEVSNGNHKGTDQG